MKRLMGADSMTGGGLVAGFRRVLISVMTIALLLFVWGCGSGGGGKGRGNTTPIADAGPDQNVTVGLSVILDGSGSSDAEGDSLTYSWSFTSRPGGSAAGLTAPTTVNPTFIPDVDGTYVISLVVNDGKVSSAADTVSITASVSAGKTPPTLSNLRLSKSSLPVPRVHEQFLLTLTFDFEDPDGDLDQLRVTFTGPQGTLRSAAESFHAAEAKGTYSDDLLIDSSYTAGVYQLSYELKDREGQGSGVQTASFTLEEAAERPLEIIGISPESGRPGDSIVITGKGFEETSSANRVSFRGSIGSAEILSATTDRIEVIVPQGAMTGTIGLMTSSGRTESQSPFTVNPTITISPVITRMVTDQTVDFSCMVSGIDSPRLEWSVNHQATPDLSLGTIDATGNYRSPQTVPPANPVTIRCASADDPAVYAELQVEIIPPVPPPGEGTMVQAATGGEIESAKGEVRVVIPRDVLTSDTVITVEQLTPDALPAASEDSINLAAARLSPPGLQFSQPVTVIFTLRNWEEPGSGLPLFLLDETTGSLVDTGKMVIVDDTGLKATGEVDHFSTYIVARTLSVYELSMANTFNTLSQLFTEFYIETPPEISFLEGLSVPVLIRRHHMRGPESGIGPFARGVTITPVLSGYTQSNTPLSAGPVVQPSADGWQLGTVINIPTLTNCGEGQTIGATLVIGYQQSALSKTMNIPFTIECLPELNFSGVSPLNPIPEGVQVINRTLVTVRTGRTYRFSEITIGQGGILSVVSETTAPAVIEVTGDVSVYGEIITAGSNGYKGGDGEGADEGGAGGYQGWAYGGRGGKGGPTSTTNERDGQDAFYGGGSGGEHGLKWDAGSELKLQYQLLRTAYDLYSQDYISAIQDAYGVYAEYVKIDSNPENARLSSGGGGGGGHAIHVWDVVESGMSELPVFVLPAAGGGGGGGGKMVISMEFDNAGGGGGGGGGTASSLKLVVGGVLYLDAGARVDGKGGDGGNGGNGSSTWPNQAAGGGGGGGGSGAQTLIIANEVRSNGEINLKGGTGGLSGESGFTEVAWGEETVLVLSGFGGSGGDGIIRVDGKFIGQSPMSTTFFKGPVMGPIMGTGLKIMTDNLGFSNWCRDIFLGEHDYYPGWKKVYYYVSPIINGIESPVLEYMRDLEFPEWYIGQAYRNICFDNLSEGLNTLSLKVRQSVWNLTEKDKGLFVDLHPWEKQYVFYFPGFSDRDHDGLNDRLETLFGTNLVQPDTDGDGYTDGEEVYTLGTDPKVKDRYTLTTHSTAGGRVTKNPDLQYYIPGTVVTLTAIPDPDFAFARWYLGSTPIGATNSVSVTIDADKEVTAAFVNINPLKTKGWSEPESISSPAQAVGPPELAVDSAGNAIVVWYQAGGIYANRFLTGSGWEGPVLVSPVGTFIPATPVGMAMNPSGQAIVTWQSTISGIGRIYAVRYNPVSGWGSAEQIDITYDLFSLDVAIDNSGNSLIVWRDGRTIKAKFYSVVSGWKSTEGIDEVSGSRPRAVMDSAGLAVVVWDTVRDISPGGNVRGSVYDSRSTYGWGLRYQISFSGDYGHPLLPDIAVDQHQHGIGVWQQNDSIWAYRFSYRSYYGLDNSGSPELIESSSTVAHDPQVTMDPDGNSVAIWVQGDRIWANRYNTLLFRGWTGPLVIQTGDVAAYQPSIVMDRVGNGMVVWVQEGKVWTREFIAEKEYVAGSVWQPAIQVSDAQNGAEDPKVGVDSNGNAFTVWIEWNPAQGQGSIRTSRFRVIEDLDADGLADVDEIMAYGTDPALWDTDGDGLGDGDEVNIYRTNPLKTDSDGDGFSDLSEIQAGTNPNNSDTDGDGVSDWEEVYVYNTDPLVSDTDGDGLTDGREVNIYRTNPLKRDTDGDGYSDYYEVTFGFDPLDPAANPRLTPYSYLDLPEAEAGANFGFAVAAIVDADGGGKDDILISAPYKDVGGNTMSGRVYLFSAETGSLIRTFDHPYPATAPAGFGYAVSAIRDMDNDGVEDVVIGSPFDAVAIIKQAIYGEAGRVFIFSGRTGQLLGAYSSPNIKAQGHFGMSVAAPHGFFWAGSWSGYPIPPELGNVRLIVGEPGGGPNGGGRAYALGDNNTVAYDFPNPEDTAGVNFGQSVSLAGYYSFPGESGGGGGCEIMVGAPGSDGTGKVFVTECTSLQYYGPLPSSISQQDSQHGRVVTHLDWLGPREFPLGAPGRASSSPMYDAAAVVDAGAVEVYLPQSVWEISYSPKGRSQYAGFNAVHPQPQIGAQFGSSITYLKNQPPGYEMVYEAIKAIAVAAPNQDVGLTIDQGLVYLYNIYGDVLGIIGSPNLQAGAHFGAAMVSLADYRLWGASYLAVAAPDESVNGRTGQGRVYLYEARGISKIDSDQDGLYDAWETVLGTNPNNSDTDGDGVSDWEEVYVYKTDPLKASLCGNNILEAGEQCDGDKFPPAQDTCQELGFPGGGTLICNNNCTFNENACLECTSSYDCPFSGAFLACVNGNATYCNDDSECSLPYVCLGGQCVIF